MLHLNNRTVPGLIAAGVFILIVSTAPQYGLTFDEPLYFRASDLEIQWIADFISGVINGNGASILSEEKIKAAWRWNPYHVPHPPFSRLVSGTTKALAAPFIDKFTAYRIGSALFFTLLVIASYVWMGELCDKKTGLFSAFAILLMPNLFGFAHFANTDMALTALWFLTAYCFTKGLQSWKWSLALGTVWGLALATKFPAFLIPIPLFIWAHLYHRRNYANNLFSMVFLSPIVMIGCQPYLWHQTLPRLATFLYDSVSRGYRWETDFPIFFFHQIYRSSTVPWYYPFFMTLVMIPETFLGLFLAGFIAMAWMKTQREVMVLFLLNAGSVLAMGLFPGAVLHDVNRLTLPALPFLTSLASCGFFFLTCKVTAICGTTDTLQRIRHLRLKLTAALLLLALFPPALDVIHYHPYELSYYNRLVGGIRGAYQKGLEVTYLMEALTPKFLRLLNQRLPPHAAISGSGRADTTHYNYMFEYYQKEKGLRPDIRITNPMAFDYYILLNRHSLFTEFDRAVSTHVVPDMTLELDGVPLISIYRREDINRMSISPTTTGIRTGAGQL